MFTGSYDDAFEIIHNIIPHLRHFRSSRLRLMHPVVLSKFIVARASVTHLWTWQQFMGFLRLHTLSHRMKTSTSYNPFSRHWIVNKLPLPPTKADLRHPPVRVEKTCRKGIDYDRIVKRMSLITRGAAHPYNLILISQAKMRDPKEPNTLDLPRHIKTIQSIMGKDNCYLPLLEERLLPLYASSHARRYHVTDLSDLGIKRVTKKFISHMGLFGCLSGICCFADYLTCWVSVCVNRFTG